MTDLRKAAEEFIKAWDAPIEVEDRIHLTIKKLRQALAQPEQEPIKYKCTIIDDEHPNGIPLEQWGNTSPPKRKWVGLTDEEIDKTMVGYPIDYKHEFAKAIEAKLKEKNT